jgi:hypothetical protein
MEQKPGMHVTPLSLSCRNTAQGSTMVTAERDEPKSQDDNELSYSPKIFRILIINVVIYRVYMEVLKRNRGVVLEIL